MTLHKVTNVVLCTRRSAGPPPLRREGRPSKTFEDLLVANHLLLDRHHLLLVAALIERTLRRRMAYCCVRDGLLEGSGLARRVREQHGALRERRGGFRRRHPRVVTKTNNLLCVCVFIRRTSHSWYYNISASPPLSRRDLSRLPPALNLLILSCLRNGVEELLMLRVDRCDCGEVVRPNHGGNDCQRDRLRVDEQHAEADENGDDR